MTEERLPIRHEAPIKIVLVHGFNVFDGGKLSIDVLIPYLRQQFPNCFIDKDEADYKHGLIKVRFFSKSAVKRIAKAIQNADIVITHSNGANYTMRALKLLKKENKENPGLHIIHISPALNRKQKLYKYKFRKISVLYSKSDKVVWLSKWLPFHSWGNAGQKGLITNDERYTGYEFTRTYHSGWFGTLSKRSLASFIGLIIMEIPENEK